MAGNMKPDTYITSDYANWLPFLTNTQNELNEIEKLGASAYVEIEMLNIFYARFRLFMATRWTYIQNEKKLKDKLESIGSTLYSKNYLNDLKKFKTLKFYENPNFMLMHKRLLDGILDVLDIVSKDFAKYKILYYAEVQKKTPGAVKGD